MITWWQFILACAVGTVPILLAQEFVMRRMAKRYGRTWRWGER